MRFEAKSNEQGNLWGVVDTATSLPGVIAHRLDEEQARRVAATLEELEEDRLAAK